MPKQDVAVELFYGGTWHNLVKTDDVLADTVITIVRGQGDEGAALRPCSVTCRLANDDDMYRTGNPESPLYGNVGVNTPLRVSVAGVVRGIVEASSWKAGQSSDFRPAPRRGKAWVDVQGGGLLQRVNNWSEPEKSVLRVASEGLAGVSGYWPMEDPSGATTATSLVDGAESAYMYGHSFGSQKSPPGGGTAVDVGANGNLFLTFLRGNINSTAGWQFNRVIYLNKFTGPTVADAIMRCDLMNGYIIDMQVDGGTFFTNLLVIDGATGGTVTSASVDTSEYPWLGRWIMVQLQASYSAGTTTVAAYWRAVGEDAWTTFSVSYAGPTSDIASSGSYLPEGSSYGHVIGTQGLASALTSGDRFSAFEGYAAERASYRFARLCTNRNLLYYVSASYDASMPMGPQGVDTLSNDFRELADTEDALIFDHRTELRLFFLSRADRYSQTPALVLNAREDPSGLPNLPVEVTDDLPIHNIVTAAQRGGGDYTARDDTSAMGTQDPPDGRGEYKQKVNVNVADPAFDLPNEANWWLYRGTVAQARYPSVTVNLAAVDADKVAEVEAVDVGSVIEIHNYRENVIRLYVLGYTETIGTHSRSITFVCAPDEIFGTAAVLDTVVLDSATTTLKAALNPTDTAATFTTANVLDAWDTSATPFDVMIAGQRNTVTAIGAATLVSGSYDQAATLRRGVNGIRKTLGAGEEIHLAGTYGRLML